MNANEDPELREKVTDAILDLWDEHPQLRFGQLLHLIVNCFDPIDIYYKEDTWVIDMIENVRKRDLP